MLRYVMLLCYIILYMITLGYYFSYILLKVFIFFPLDYIYILFFYILILIYKTLY